MGNKEYRITFAIEGGETLSALAPEGETLLETARKAGIDIDAPCSGNGTCGKCRVRLAEGAAEGAVPRQISPEDYAAGWRLACGIKVISDLTLEVPPSAGAFKNRMKVTDLSEGRERAAFEALGKDMDEMGFRGDSGLETIALSLAPPAMDDAMADRERLLAKYAETSGREAELSIFALRKLPQTLRESDFSIICVLRKGEDRDPAVPSRDLILDILPPGAEPVLPGLAVDIGTTSVAMVLTDLRTGKLLAGASGGNGQIRFGADVISRIIASTKKGGLERLRRAVVEECILPLIQGICTKAGIPTEGIYRAVVAANTTMTHLFTGVYADYLRLEPYVPTFFQTAKYRSIDLGLNLNPDAEVLLAPSIGSYVGGDITAGVLSSGIYKKDTFSLFVDLGTNGELVFGNSELLMSCACSAGPAFEGGDISCGMRATDGAVEACSIDAETMEPALTIIGPPGQKAAGLCGSGLIDAIGELFRCGIINAKGKIIKEGKRISHDEYGAASYILAFGADSVTGADVSLNEVDIDSFIRAKGAIFSAIRSMLAIMDFSVDAIEEVYVAGGIGSGINVEKAIRIGMFPKIPVEKYHYIGNTSLSGAYAMVSSAGAAAKVTEISQGITYLELSSHPGYMDEFVAACFLPHTNGALFE
ncbi:ferredoxin [Treponema primitia ZAS-2]|uniref:Ferredoxin n=1 Tax=Treponema primitia (strain ATCC BAA-887 / DSM 12427 / ZAS-2) TaxID=545694 RepID=F5YMN4_TREPZ|nr:corrinoid activation/regeneration protein AcsV [Treponema primitia]AEF83806.1 ferredoxin [Treponema primitia ZAS-2]